MCVSSSYFIRLNLISLRQRCTEGCPSVNSEEDSAIPTISIFNLESESLNCFMSSATLYLSSTPCIASNSSIIILR